MESTNTEPHGSYRIALEHAAKLLRTNPRLAEEQATEILKVFPGAEPAKWILASACRIQGRPQESLAISNRCLRATRARQASSTSGDAPWRRLTVPGELSAPCASAVRLDPKNAAAWRALGDLLDPRRRRGWRPGCARTLVRADCTHARTGRSRGTDARRQDWPGGAHRARIPQGASHRRQCNPSPGRHWHEAVRATTTPATCSRAASSWRRISTSRGTTTPSC